MKQKCKHKVEDGYWTINTRLSFISKDLYIKSHGDVINNNCFKTYEGAKAMVEKIKKLLLKSSSSVKKDRYISFKPKTKYPII